MLFFHGVSSSKLGLVHDYFFKDVGLFIVYIPSRRPHLYCSACENSQQIGIK